jgi:hypothetical protein
MDMARQRLAFLIVAALTVGSGCNRTLTPEQARARGDELLREMSKTVSSVQSFSYTATEDGAIADAAGKRKEQKVARDVIIRRPNGFKAHAKGDERDVEVWYDGKHVTLVGHRQKFWVRGPMPGTLDEALDYLSAEYAIQLPTADLVYSNPYDALMTADTTGGWVDRQQIGSRTCEHVAYKQPVVDWDLWTNEETKLPCQMQITYKTEPGQPKTTVTYTNWNSSPQLAADTFTPKVPEGYERLKMMRHATVVDETAEAAPAAEAATSPKTGK